MNSEDVEPQEQQRKQNYDWLKGYRYVKGQSGNPGGRPKGSKSLKTFVREYLEALPDAEKIEYLKTLSPELVWKMAEGNPHSTEDHRVEVTLPTPILNGVLSNDSSTESSGPQEAH